MIKLLNVKGVRIRLDFSLIIALIMLEWYLVSVFIPFHIPNFSVVNQIIISVSINAILIVSLIIHELAHIIIASLVGVKIRQTILFIFGGVYETSLNGANEKNSYHNKLKIALAGPVASIGLALLFALAWLLEFQEINPKEIFMVKQAISIIFVYASVGNVLLALINIIPVLPLDGGQIINFFIHRRRRDVLCETTQLKIGTICSFGFLIAGVYALFLSSFYIGILLILLAWILRDGLREYITLSKYISTEI
jgi:Zn-dependent protease